jgi:hypothetical protein
MTKAYGNYLSGYYKEGDKIKSLQDLHWPNPGRSGYVYFNTSGNFCMKYADDTFMYMYPEYEEDYMLIMRKVV